MINTMATIPQLDQPIDHIVMPRRERISYGLAIFSKDRAVLCVQHYIGSAFRDLLFEMYAWRKPIRWFSKVIWNLSARELGILRSQSLLEEEVNRYAPQRLGPILRSYKNLRSIIVSAQPKEGVLERRWSLPGGASEVEDASVHATLERELFEETGIKIEELSVDPVEYTAKRENVAMRNVIYTATLISDRQIPSILDRSPYPYEIIDKSEVQRVAFIPFDRLSEYLQPHIVDLLYDL